MPPRWSCCTSGAGPVRESANLPARSAADRPISMPPSPHVQDGAGVRGYARDYGQRRIELLADRDGLDCVTVIGVHRPSA